MTMFGRVKAFWNKAISIENIMVIRLVCGFYCGFNCKKSLRVAMRIYCVIISGMFSATLLEASLLELLHDYDVHSPAMIRFKLFIEYIMYVTLAFVSDGEHFHKCYSELKSYNTLEINTPISKFLFAFSSGFHFCRFLYSRHMAKPISVKSITEIAGLFAVRTFCHLNAFSRLILFELMWQRMKNLRKSIERSAVTTRGGGDVGALQEDTRRWLRLYKALIETTLCTNVPMKLGVVTQIILTFCNVIFNLIYIPELLASSWLVAAIMWNCLEIILILALAVLATLISSETDKLQLFVKKRLNQCTDKKAREPLEDALLYLTERPFKFTLWRVCQLDVSMIVGMMGIYTTFLIALIQFMHLF